MGKSEFQCCGVLCHKENLRSAISLLEQKNKYLVELAIRATEGQLTDHDRLFLEKARKEEPEIIVIV